MFVLTKALRHEKHVLFLIIHLIKMTFFIGCQITTTKHVFHVVFYDNVLVILDIQT
jgi:hypothetical protein